MAFTCRLKPEIQAAAQAEAERMGISLMALVSVAVRGYLDRPPTAISVERSSEPAPALLSSQPAVSSPKPKPASKPKHRSGLAALTPAARRHLGA